MLSRLCAGWLTILILLPCAAPFSTCDLATLAGSVTRHSAGGELLAPGSDTSSEAGTATHALPNRHLTHRRQLIATSSLLHPSLVPSPEIVTDRVTTPGPSTPSIFTPLRL